MTAKEAAERIRKRIVDMYDHEAPYPIDLGLAIEALNKQIPQKPVHGCCPDCGIALKSFAPYTYCAKCGRKLDYPWCCVEDKEELK